MSDDDEVTVAADLTAADALAHLDREIAELVTARAVLARLLGIGDGAEGDESHESHEDGAEPGEVPAPKKSRPARDGSEAGTGSDETRLAIARLIRDRGPLRAGDIIEATGKVSGTVSSALKHPWFRKQPGDLRSPFELTEEGAAAASSAAP